MLATDACNHFTISQLAVRLRLWLWLRIWLRIRSGIVIGQTIQQLIWCSLSVADFAFG
ncbi:Uncharacterised protein [Vibrio cholerae]|nr:Uncharacterised protein [Vibrio cholerae]